MTIPRDSPRKELDMANELKEKLIAVLATESSIPILSERKGLQRRQKRQGSRALRDHSQTYEGVVRKGS
jgi:hypothetical protein